MIGHFDGTEHAFLSNYAPCELEFRGRAYHSAEAAYQAQKCRKKGFLYYRAVMDLFTKASPHEAKALGNLVPLVGGWDGIRDQVMEEVLRVKFAQPEFRRLLLLTGDEELVEGNHWHDTHFGRCNCERHQGQGENVLGRLLMRIRDDLRTEDGLRSQVMENLHVDEVSFCDGQYRFKLSAAGDLPLTTGFIMLSVARFLGVDPTYGVRDVTVSLSDDHRKAEVSLHVNEKGEQKHAD